MLHTGHAFVICLLFYYIQTCTESRVSPTGVGNDHGHPPDTLLTYPLHFFRLHIGIFIHAIVGTIDSPFASSPVLFDILYSAFAQ